MMELLRLGDKGREDDCDDGNNVLSLKYYLWKTNTNVPQQSSLYLNVVIPILSISIDIAVKLFKLGNKRFTNVHSYKFRVISFYYYLWQIYRTAISLMSM